MYFPKWIWSGCLVYCRNADGAEVRKWFVAQFLCCGGTIFLCRHTMYSKETMRFFMPDIRYTQNNNVDQGDLRMQVIERGTSTPIDDAQISISYSGDPESTVEEVSTDASECF